MKIGFRSRKKLFPETYRKKTEKDEKEYRHRRDFLDQVSAQETILELLNQTTDQPTEQATN